MGYAPAPCPPRLTVQAVTGKARIDLLPRILIHRNKLVLRHNRGLLEKMTAFKKTKFSGDQIAHALGQAEAGAPVA